MGHDPYLFSPLPIKFRVITYDDMRDSFGQKLAWSYRRSKFTYLCILYGLNLFDPKVLRLRVYEYMEDDFISDFVQK